MKKFLTTLISLLCIVVGLILFLYPDIQEYFLQQDTEQYIDEFESEYYVPDNSQDENNDGSGENEEDNSKEKTENTMLSKTEDKETDPLYQEIFDYNTSIYESGQADFKDAWSYVQSPIGISNLKNGRFGYIRIPAMKVKLPLYLGASNSNMAKGATVLGQTSIPIGGENTNSVIAGHRGWRTGSFFKRIERLDVGDHVFIKNPWETLVYTVESIDITSPYASEKVKIQEGRDMVTLVTCHPYLSHGDKYRYLVYCVRDPDYDWDDDEAICQAEETQGESKDEEIAPGTMIAASDGNQYESSNELIANEDRIRKIGAEIIIVVLVVTVLRLLIRKKK